jgi:hypothetical protein
MAERLALKPSSHQSWQNLFALFSAPWSKWPQYPSSSRLIVKAKEGVRSTCSPARTIKHPAYTILPLPRGALLLQSPDSLFSFTSIFQVARYSRVGETARPPEPR